MVLSTTLSGGRASVRAIAAWSTVWNCDPTHTLTACSLPAETSGCSVQLSGSIGACARYGKRNSASILRAAPLRAALISPSPACATVPGCAASFAYSSNSACDDTLEPASSHWISSASRPILAGQ
ncbi:hypothetical protein D9M68_634890 [compost metagenome]